MSDAAAAWQQFHDQLSAMGAEADRLLAPLGASRTPGLSRYWQAAARWAEDLGSARIVTCPHLAGEPPHDLLRGYTDRVLRPHVVLLSNHLSTTVQSGPTETVVDSSYVMVCPDCLPIYRAHLEKSPLSAQCWLCWSPRSTASWRLERWQDDPALHYLLSWCCRPCAEEARSW